MHQLLLVNQKKLDSAVVWCSKCGMFPCVQMCFEWFTKGQHDLESDVQQQLFKEKILKLEPYEITMNGERLCWEIHSQQHHNKSRLTHE